MNFYNNTHPYYCGIDLHARILYVCIIDQLGEVLVHKEISASPQKLLKLLEPSIGNKKIQKTINNNLYFLPKVKKLKEDGRIGNLTINEVRAYQTKIMQIIAKGTHCAWNLEKNAQLIQERRISFEHVINHIENIWLFGSN